MSIDPKNLSDDALLSDGRPFVRCPCGFVAVSDSETENRWALEEHSCSLAPVRPVVRRQEAWYSPIFSLWGFLIIVTIASAVLAGMGVKW